MPPLTKKQKQAKHQRASGTKYFNNGLIEDLLDIALDPDYQPNDKDDASDSDTPSVEVMAFSLMDDVHSTIGSVDSTDSDESLEELDDETICIGEKQKGQDDFEEAPTVFEAEEPSDYVEQCAQKAAAAAHRLWRGLMSSLPDHHAPIPLITRQSCQQYRKNCLESQHLLRINLELAGTLIALHHPFLVIIPKPPGTLHHFLTCNLEL
ncbi:hypothetical protein BS17DRAFT_767390 [Gyrodon lividus]|nr:hypothetical protein BS17DRAFT_767390 [Gyrodon lividus]